MNEIAQKSQEGFPIAGEHQIYLKYWRRNKRSRFSNHLIWFMAFRSQLLQWNKKKKHYFLEGGIKEAVTDH